jgi:hypothetical protein
LEKASTQPAGRPLAVGAAVADALSPPPPPTPPPPGRSQVVSPVAVFFQ